MLTKRWSCASRWDFTSTATGRLVDDTAVLLNRPGHFHRPREEDIVLKMDVPVEISFELLQSLIESAETGTGVGRRLKGGSQRMDPGQCLARVVVFGNHSLDRELDTAKTRSIGSVSSRGFFQPVDHGEQDAFLFEHMVRQLGSESVE